MTALVLTVDLTLRHPVSSSTTLGQCFSISTCLSLSVSQRATGGAIPKLSRPEFNTFLHY